MTRRVPLAWLQLKRERLRLIAAIAGVAFGVVLIFVQLGFRKALFDSAVRFHDSLGYDIAIVSPKTDTLVRTEPFPRSRVFQAIGVAGVAAATPVYLASGTWRNPANPVQTNSLFVVGVDPADRAFEWPGIASNLAALRLPDQVLFDRSSRPEFGPVAALFERDGPLSTEINNRRVRVVGLFDFGTSFGIDGSVFTSDLNFQRLFPDRPTAHLDLGLVYLEPGADLEAVRAEIDSVLLDDVDVLTRSALIDREIAYWNSATPIGYVFSFGVIMGLVVGMVIVYQILFSDVQDSLREYATLKAMGYSHRYLVGVVLRQAILLALFGFLPAIAISVLLYRQAGEATNLPLEMSTARAVGVLGLTVGMCAVSALLALRKLRSAEPAEVF